MYGGKTGRPDTADSQPTLVASRTISPDDEEEVFTPCEISDSNGDILEVGRFDSGYDADAE